MSVEWYQSVWMRQMAIKWKVKKKTTHIHTREYKPNTKWYDRQSTYAHTSRMKWETNYESHPRLMKLYHRFSCDISTNKRRNKRTRYPKWNGPTSSNSNPNKMRYARTHRFYIWQFMTIRTYIPYMHMRLGGGVAKVIMQLIRFILYTITFTSAIPLLLINPSVQNILGFWIIIDPFFFFFLSFFVICFHMGMVLTPHLASTEKGIEKEFTSNRDLYYAKRIICISFV